MSNIYWHIQMYLPDGRKGEAIDSIKMLQEPQPVIGTGEWDNHQCRNFKSSSGGGMDIGNIVLVREGKRPLALCLVTSDSFHDAKLELKYINCNYRRVKVLEFYDGHEDFPQPQGTLQKLRDSNTPSWKFIDKWYKQILQKMATNQIVDILKQKKQVVLQGAPGTGKTYITASVALALMGETYNPVNHDEVMEKYNRLVDEGRIFFTTFHQSMDYEDFVEGLKPVVVDGAMTYEVKDGIFKTACKSAEQKDSLQDIDKAIEQLKQDCYEESLTAKTVTGVSFSIGYRGGRTFRVRSVNSKAVDGQDFPVNIEAIKDYYRGRREGIYNVAYVRGLCEFLKKRYDVEEYKPQQSDLNYLLIIDEINRGNISKIFGELITLLEADKREGGDHTIRARLAYSNEENFSVPANLYIIGTMNTTDRSVGYIDYAIRRRFAFYTLTANKEAVADYYNGDTSIGEETKKIALHLFAQVYDFIKAHLSPEFDIDDIMVGHSYFMAKEMDSLRMKLEYEIIPLLREYEKDGIIALKPDERSTIGQEWKKLFDAAQ